VREPATAAVLGGEHLTGLDAALRLTTQEIFSICVEKSFPSPAPTWMVYCFQFFTSRSALLPGFGLPRPIECFLLLKVTINKLMNRVTAFCCYSKRLSWCRGVAWQSGTTIELCARCSSIDRPGCGSSQNVER
jgi:hypothetical protein